MPETAIIPAIEQEIFPDNGSYDLVRSGRRQVLHWHRERDRQWVRNVQKTPKIKLSIGGENFEGNARFLTDRAEHERAMAAIRRK